MSKETLEQKAAVYKALGHHYRVAIVEFLADGEQCVQEIVKHLETAQSNTSLHLRVLRFAGVVQAERRGLKVFYSLAMPSVASLNAALSEDLAG